MPLETIFLHSLVRNPNLSAKELLWLHTSCAASTVEDTWSKAWLCVPCCVPCSAKESSRGRGRPDMFSEPTPMLCEMTRTFLVPLSLHDLLHRRKEDDLWMMLLKKGFVGFVVKTGQEHYLIIVVDSLSFFFCATPLRCRILLPRWLQTIWLPPFEELPWAQVEHVFVAWPKTIKHALIHVRRGTRALGNDAGNDCFIFLVFFWLSSKYCKKEKPKKLSCRNVRKNSAAKGS